MGYTRVYIIRACYPDEKTSFPFRIYAITGRYKNVKMCELYEHWTYGLVSIFMYMVSIYKIKCSLYTLSGYVSEYTSMTRNSTVHVKDIQYCYVMLLCYV